MCEIINHKKCLLLNADYSLIGLIEWTKAIIWSISSYNQKYSIEIIDFYKNDFIKGVNKKYPVPAVAKTKKYYNISKYPINFNRKNLFIRDNYTCQYCGTKLCSNELTYDHIIPKSIWDYSEGSPTKWTNIATSCLPCNRKKANKTPKQAKMKLKNLPYEPDKNPKYLSVIQDLSRMNYIPSEWLQYIPTSYKNA
jgi:hypothetical protein